MSSRSLHFIHCTPFTAFHIINRISIIAIRVIAFHCHSIPLRSIMFSFTPSSVHPPSSFIHSIIHSSIGLGNSSRGVPKASWRSPEASRRFFGDAGPLETSICVMWSRMQECFVDLVEDVRTTSPKCDRGHANAHPTCQNW